MPFLTLKIEKKYTFNDITFYYLQHTHKQQFGGKHLKGPLNLKICTISLSLPELQFCFDFQNT
jgi:hypothetical protein